MSSFDEADRRAKYAVIPKSSNDLKIVKLKVKELKTEKEVRTVLPENKYLNNLEKIIVKDYFPELPKLKAQAEYMDALARNDVAKMRELQLRFATGRRTERRTSPTGGRLDTASTGRRLRGTSPSVFDPDSPGPSRVGDTPTWNEEGDNDRQLPKKKKKNELEDMSVDAYLNKFTSEDNASFEELADLMKKKERVYNKWIYDAAELHNKEKVKYGAIEGAADMQLALKYDVETQKARPSELDNWAYTARNTVLFHPEGAELTPQEKIEMAQKNQRIINKESTRFEKAAPIKPSESSMARAAFMQAQNHAGRVDVTGQEAGVKTSTLGLIATPSPMPGVDDSPLMTWGEIDGTPFRLDGADIEPGIDNAPTFKIPDVPVREQIAQSISDTIAQRYRDKRRHAMKQAEKAHKSPRFGSIRSSDKLAQMSPAARRLASNQLGIRLGSTDKLKKAYTPSPSPRTSGSTPSSLRSGTSSHSISSSIRRKDVSTPVRSSITDGLLKIGGNRDSELASQQTEDFGNVQAQKAKPRAGDFF